MALNRQTRRMIVTAVILLVAYGVQWWSERQGGTATETPSQQRPAKAPSQKRPAEAPPAERGTISARPNDVQRVIDAFNKKRSGLMVEVDVTIVHILRDDNEGDRHQRFLVEMSRGPTIKIAHNIDLAKRVPARKGDRLRVKGQYEWNDKGGVIHWTHHDPRGRHEGGWIDHDGLRYE